MSDCRVRTKDWAKRRCQSIFSLLAADARNVLATKSVVWVKTVSAAAVLGMVVTLTVIPTAGGCADVAALRIAVKSVLPGVEIFDRILDASRRTAVDAGLAIAAAGNPVGTSESEMIWRGVGSVGASEILLNAAARLAACGISLTVEPV